jgi:hypothetical protein
MHISFWLYTDASEVPRSPVLLNTGLKSIQLVTSLLVREMARIQKLYGMSREGFVLSAVRRLVDECEVLAYQAIKGEL